MTLPDKLVTAAAEACRKVMADAVIWKDVDPEQADAIADACAQVTLAAAFAALPECDLRSLVSSNVRPWLPDVLAALAKEYGS